MLTAIEGIYQNGKIELYELPPGVRQARVVVTFLDLTAENRQIAATNKRPELPTIDLGTWPEGFTARREEIYDDDGR